MDENSAAFSDSPVLRLTSFVRRAVSTAGSTSPEALWPLQEGGGCLGRLPGGGGHAEHTCTALLCLCSLCLASFVDFPPAPPCLARWAGLPCTGHLRAGGVTQWDRPPSSWAPSGPWTWNPVRRSWSHLSYGKTPVPPARSLPPGPGRRGCRVTFPIPELQRYGLLNKTKKQTLSA